MTCMMQIRGGNKTQDQSPNLLASSSRLLDASHHTKLIKKGQGRADKKKDFYSGLCGEAGSGGCRYL